MALHGPASPTRFTHDAPGISRAPSNFDEGFSEETQSQTGSDAEMAGNMKDASDRTTHLVGQLDSLSLLDRLSVMRNTAASLSPQDQLRKSLACMLMLRRMDET
jgi:hypothetical protein